MEIKFKKLTKSRGLTIPRDSTLTPELRSTLPPRLTGNSSSQNMLIPAVSAAARKRLSSSEVYSAVRCAQQSFIRR